MKAKWFLMASVLIAGVSFTACDDNDPPKNPDQEIQFPSKVSFTLDAGEQKTLTFKAEANWILTTNRATWCTFSENGQESVTGSAGDAEVTVYIGDANQGFDDDTAMLTLKMGDKEQEIFEITRTGIKPSVKMFVRKSYSGDEWQSMDEVAISYTATSRASETYDIGFTANFDWKIIGSSVDLISLSDAGLQGKAGQSETDPDFPFTRVSAYEGDNDWEGMKQLAIPFTEGYITIGDMSEIEAAEFTVSYNGMLDSDISFTPANFATGNLAFSQSGDVLDRGTGESTGSKEYTVNVAAKDMAYDYYLVQLGEDNVPVDVTEEATWIEVDDDGQGTVKLKVAGDGVNSDPDRSLYIFILAKGQDRDFADYFDEDGYLVSTGRGAMITQKGVVPGSGFFVGWGPMQAAVPEGDIIPVANTEINPVEHGLPENSYVYKFSDTDILTETYDLFVVPLGMPDGWVAADMNAGELLFELKVIDSPWSSANVSFTTIYPIDTFGAAISNLQSVSGDKPLAALLFYLDLNDKNSGNAATSLILMKD